MFCDKALSKYEKEGGSLPLAFNFKIVARIMLLTNINIADKLENGQFGTVKRFCYYSNSYEIEYIYIDMDESVDLSQKVLNNEEYDNYVYIQRCYNEISYRRSGKIKRTRFSLALVWDCTVDKVQGMTLTRLAVSVELFNQKSFSYGQLYVTLSRTTSLEELCLKGPVTESMFRANPNVTEH